MLSFRQFITEKFPSHEYKAWVSPSGTIHKFGTDKEHNRNPHPELVKKVDKFRPSIDSLRKHGYARLGKYKDMDYIQFDHTHPHAVNSALHGLKHLNPEKGHTIMVMHKHEINGPQDEKQFNHPLAAQNYIKSFKS